MKSVHKSCRKLACLLPATLLVMAASAPGATKTWDGGAATLNWGDGANWDTDGIPAINDTIRFDGGIAASATVNVNVGTLSSPGSTSLALNNGAGFTLDFNQTGGSYNYIPTVAVSDAQTYFITGAAGKTFAFPTGTQTFNVADGGKLGFTGNVVVAGYASTNISKTGAGELDLTGFTNTEGGSINALTISGGTLRAPVRPGRTILNSTGATSLSLSGTPGNSYLDAGSRSVAVSDTLTLNGVTLHNDALVTAWVATTATVHLTNGGGLDVRGQSNVSIDQLTGTGNVYNSYSTATLTVGANGGSSTFEGVIYGSAGTAGGVQNYGRATYDGNSATLGLTKTGTGTLTLTNTSVYTGATLVSAGTLLVNGALGNTAVTVGADGAIGGDGILGGTLNFAAGADLVFSTTATLTVNGTTVSFADFRVGNLAGLTSAVDPGIYHLIDGAATVNPDNLANIGLANAHDLGGGKQAYFEIGSLNLVVIPEPSAALLGGLGMLVLLRRRRN